MAFTVPSAWQSQRSLARSSVIESNDLQLLIENDRYTWAHCQRTLYTFTSRTLFTTTSASYVTVEDDVASRTSSDTRGVFGYFVRLRGTGATASCQITIDDGTNTDSLTVTTAGVGSYEDLTGTWTIAGSPGTVDVSNSTILITVQTKVTTAGGGNNATLAECVLWESALTASDL